MLNWAKTASNGDNIQCSYTKVCQKHAHVCITPFFLPSQDSLCSPQLIMEDEGLCRLAQTVQALVGLADGSQRALKQETLGTTGSTQC